MEDNKLKGLLCYLFGWITGIFFYLTSQDPYVRFHAMQSIITFLALTILDIVISFVGSLDGFGLWSMMHLISELVGLVTLGLWILLMVKAYQGERFKLPVIGDFVEKNTNNSINI